MEEIFILLIYEENEDDVSLPYGLCIDRLIGSLAASQPCSLHSGTCCGTIHADVCCDDRNLRPVMVAVVCIRQRYYWVFCAIVCDIEIRRVRSYAHVSSLVCGVAGIGGGAQCM
jgi:hypothetical protein